MASAILATFNAEDVQRFGEQRFQQLMAAITPALNVWAGEPVCWVPNDGGYMVCGSSRPAAAVAFPPGTVVDFVDGGRRDGGRRGGIVVQSIGPTTAEFRWVHFPGCSEPFQCSVRDLTPWREGASN